MIAQPVADQNDAENSERQRDTGKRGHPPELVANDYRPSLSICPQETSGGCMPKPRKLREDSIRMTEPMFSVATTTKEEIVFGRMCLRMIRA